jgi:trans-aconitate methyltransferase
MAVSDIRKALWSKSAAQYSAHTRRFDTHSRITCALLDSLDGQPCTTVVDFGCGPGNSTEIIAKRFPGVEIHAIDYAEGMLAQARSRFIGSPARVRLASDLAEIEAWRLEAPSRSANGIDLVVCSNSFFHVEDKRRLLAAFGRLMSPMLTLVFSMYESVLAKSRTLSEPAADPLSAEIVERLRKHGYSVSRRVQDRERFTQDSLAELFSACGFSLVNTGVVRLIRAPEERLSFFAIPAVAKESFPDIPAEAVAAVAREMLKKPNYPPVLRNVFTLRADRK